MKRGRENDKKAVRYRQGRKEKGKLVGTGTCGEKRQKERRE